MRASARPDLAIVGGGPAGLACALAARRAGARVALFERAPSLQKPGEVIEAAIGDTLSELGIWTGFLARGYRRISENVACWGTGEPYSRSSMRNAHGEGFLIDRRDFEHWLRAEVADAGVRLIVDAGPLKIGPKGSGGGIEWRDGSIASPLVVDATGRQSTALGRPRERIDKLVGLLAYVDWPVRLRSDDRLLIEATGAGWWYSAALPDGRAVIAFMTDADLVPSAREGRLRWLDAQLAVAGLTAERLAGTAASAGWQARPAQSSRQPPGTRIWHVAIGDAAAAYDPLSGLGVTAAMAKGAALARLLATRARAGAVRQYRAAEADAWSDYLRIRRRIYGGEVRWPANPFWVRRSH